MTVAPGPLRVAYVLGTSTGGIGRHVRSLVAGLTQRQMLVSVYCPAATEERFGFTAAGARVTPLEISAEPGPRDARTIGQLRRGLRIDPVDVLHAHGLRAGLVAAWARPGSLPLVVTWHNAVLGDGLWSRAQRVGERIVARSADVTLCASEDLLERATRLGARDARLGVVAAPRLGPPTRDPADVRQELEAADRPLVLSVGRLHPQKDYETLIAAAARWRDLDPTPLVAIAGTGPSYRRLAARILTERAPVILLGHRNDVADLLAAADLAVITSIWEARQLFAQEALAAGVPLVATRVGGLPGLVGDAAVLVPPRDVDAVDAAVRSLIADAELRAHYAAAGRAQAAQWPTEEDTLDQVHAVYTELTSRTSAVRP